MNLTINVSPELHADMKRRADERGITMTGLVKQAVSLYRFVTVENPDGTLLLVDGDDVREVVMAL